MPSFDAVSDVNLAEVDNAVNQALKEVGQRFDFKGTDTEIKREKLELRIDSADDFKVKAAVDVLQSKLAKREVPLKSLVMGKIEPAASGRAKQVITIQQGIASEKAKEIVKHIKDSKMKVQAQIQGEQVRVSGKKRDDLQAVIQLLSGKDFGLPLQFINFRD